MEKSIQTPEMSNFNDALRQIMRVSKVQLTQIRAQEKAKTADKPKRGPKTNNRLQTGRENSGKY